MANLYINLYMNNPTAGGTDGTIISTNGDYTSPLTVTLDAATSETKTVKLAIRTESGYVTTTDTTISDVGDTNDRWKLSLTENGTFADSLTFPNTIGGANVLFYARASSSVAEDPQSDRSVSFSVVTTVGAV